MLGVSRYAFLHLLLRVCFMRFLSLFFVLVSLSACVSDIDVERPEVPQLSDGVPFYQSAGPVVASASSVKIGGNVYQLNQLQGQLELNDVPVCDAVGLVLTDSLGVQTSCTATGNVWFRTGREISASEAFRAFVLVLQRSGVVVATSGGVISVSGAIKEEEAGGFARAGEVVSSLVEPLGDNAYRYAGKDIPKIHEVSDTLVRQSVGAGVIESIPGTVELAEVLQTISDSVGYSVQVASDGSKLLVSGPENEVALVRAAARAGDEITVPLRVGAIDGTTVTALQGAFPELSFSHDSHKSVLYVRGYGENLERAMPSLRSHISEPRQVRLDAAFLEWSSRSDLTFATAIEGADGRFRASLGAVVEGNAVSFGGPLRATLSAIESLGSTSILATPSLTVLDGRAAKFVSGDQVPILTRTEDTDGNLIQNVEYRDTGVVLNAAVSLANDGTITVTAQIEVTQVREAEGVLGNPIFSTRLVDTSVRVTDGQSVVISGLNVDQNGKNTSGTPLLARVGLLGQRGKASSRSELLIVITPRLLASRGSALRQHTF